MADSAITVDELAIRIAANADEAATSIDRLTAALERMSLVLGPTLTKLSALATQAGRVSTRALKASGAASVPVAATQAATISQGLAPLAASSFNPGAAAATAAMATNAALQKTGGIVSTVKTKVASFTQRLRDMGSTGQKAAQGMSGSFIQLRSWVFFALFGIGLLVKGFQALIGQASASIETANLFGVAFGNMTDKALQWVQVASGNLGLDPAQMMKTSATFMDMGRSMGIVTDQAYLMAKGLTQLSYDYASLRDQPFDVAAQKFQSAFAGQTRAIRAYGLDVTQAALQDEIYREGLNYKIRDLNRASKSIILYNALMRNSTRAQGDLARTLSSPANMMRILHDTLIITARAFGYLFIPALKIVLPWLIAIAQSALAAAQALGAFFGIKIPSWGELVNAMGGVSVGAADAEDSMAGVADSADKAANAAKRLRDYTLGIDELNILSPETLAGGGAAGGGAGGSVGGVAPGIKPVMPYDFGNTDMLEKIVAPIKKMMAEAAKALKPFIDAVGRVWDALKPFMQNVWKGFTEFWTNVLIPLGVWTMNTAGVWVLDRVRGILQWFNDNPGAAKALGAALATFTALKGFDLFIGIVSKLWGLLGGLFSLKFLGVVLAWVGTFVALVAGPEGLIGAIGAAFAAGGLWEGFAAIAAACGPPGWVVAAIVAGIAVIVAAGLLLWKNWDTVKAKAAEIWAAIAPVWNNIVAGTKAAWAAVWGVLSWFGNLIKTVFLLTVSLLLSAVITTWTTIKTKTKEAWDWVYSKIKGPLDAIWKFLNPMMNAISKKVSDVWAGLKKGLEPAWNFIKDIFKKGVNFVIDAINNGPVAILNKLIDTANKLPGAGIVGQIDHISNIPRLAAGGLPSRGSLFVAGEAGPELTGAFQGNRNTVMPLENSGFVEAMYGAVFKAVANGISGLDTGGDGNVYLDGQKVGKVLRDSDRRSGVDGSLVRVVA